jgi:SpoVK/Ycf46/Vps4 family AAA+-type ATPase
LLGYALNLLYAMESASEEAEALLCWMAGNRQRLGLNAGLFIAADTDRCRRNVSVPAIGDARWQDITDAVLQRLSADEESRESNDLDAGIATVAAALGLAGLDSALFGLMCRYRTDGIFERLFDAIATSRRRPVSLRRHPDLFALFLDAPPAEVNKHLRTDGALLTSGAVVVDSEGEMHIPMRVQSLAERCGHSRLDVRAELLGAPLAAKLPWSAFRHLGRDIEIARMVLGRSVSSKPAERGVHILLYGPPGTGKTECAQSLAREIGVPLHSIGEQSEHGQEPDRAERMSSLLLAQRIGSGAPVLYLFDEAEDLFRPARGVREPDPKIFIHRLLETAPVPMIWVVNDLESVSPAVLRRMTMCIEARLPAQARRAELWREQAAAEGVTLDARTAAHLARTIPAAPAITRTALRAARLADGAAETVAIVAEGIARAVGHGRVSAPEPDLSAAYDPSLSNADADLLGLCDRLGVFGAPLAISLLLSGPPGTGKTAFARHLAGRMGLEVLQKRGSDLFGPYVGQTEANIAAAFAEARSTGAFLLFDEADSLLFDRSNAVRGWEVSQVNEMLTWMEQHPLPFACTTNLADRLDRASLRRFLVRVNFDFLLPAQAALLFESSFGMTPPGSLLRLDRLTPADFSRVARRCTILGLKAGAQEMVSQLAAEIEGREGAPRSIGFGRKG